MNCLVRKVIDVWSVGGDGRLWRGSVFWGIVWRWGMTGVEDVRVGMLLGMVYVRQRTV